MSHLVGLVLVAAVAAFPDAQTPESPIGKKIEAFKLQDYLGASHALDAWSDKQAIVIVFLGAECPLARLYAPRLVELADRYSARGVAFVGINSNRRDSLAEIGHYCRSHKIEFPVLKDPGNAIADQFGAARTPEVFVLDSDRTVRYHGRIDDQYGVGIARPSPERSDLAEALDELLAGKPVSVAQTKPAGCFIGRVDRQPPRGEITYAKHIASIFNQRCVSCHRTGEIAPFALTSYDEIAGWTQTIREVVSEGRMPPWHASPEHGKFLNDTRLPDEEKQLVLEWIKNGAPEGNRADLPPPPKFVEGWRIPQPDIIIRMPRPFTVPAKGVVQYKYFTVDPGFTEDKWLKAAEARPGNRAVTHHLILFYHPPGKAQISPEQPLFNVVAAYAPGLPASNFMYGVSRRIPAGSKLVFQVHYTPNGTEHIDQSEVGLVFEDPANVKQELEIQAALNFQFRIPPGAANHRVEARHRFSQDTLLFSLTPHMHLRGKSFRFEALYPDGRSEILLDVPRYDFNWQSFYLLDEPKLMPAGTQVNLTAHYDNSPQNLANPDPRAEVTWGDQTWEEMMVGTFGVCRADQDLSLAPRIKKLESGEYEASFAYRPAKPVEAVYLAGSFNNWKPDGHKMSGPNADGRYTATLVLKPGKHEYKFVLEGRDWRSDPANRQQAGFFGNSLLVIEPPAE
jgi:peroxiredoxin